ncbi:hypothetical protein, partial [Paracoccus sp. FO-3]|uniref:hypothetical protein n=1 Tax=Paracoccus sp. FO-3 TaxID=1335059 RepID=UPI001C6152A8
SSLQPQKGTKVDDFYAARSSTMPPLTWTNFAPPFSPCPYFNRKTSRIRRMFSRPVGILRSPEIRSAALSSQDRPDLTAIARNGCPQSSEITARHHAKHACCFPDNMAKRS